MDSPMDNNPMVNLTCNKVMVSHSVSKATVNLPSVDNLHLEEEVTVRDGDRYIAPYSHHIY